MFDRTPEFRQCIRELQASMPPKLPKKPRRSGPSANEEEQLNKVTSSAYMHDAYNIASLRDLVFIALLTWLQLRHVQSLTRVLAVIKRPYLNVEVNELASTRDSNAVVDLMADVAALASLKYLTSQQRDQVDLQAKMIISKCAERVRAMEQVERSEHIFYMSFIPLNDRSPQRASQFADQ